MQEQEKRPILVIDDDDSLRWVMELTLKAAGHPVATAADCRSGLALFEQLNPSIVVTDVQMPGNSGYEVLRQVKSKAPNTIVIVITAFATIEKAVMEALKRNNWNQTKAADFLSIPRHVLTYRMEKYAIPKKRSGSS